MPNRSTDTLFQLIKTLEKGEKRNFKLYVNRTGGAEELKTVLLFDALDKMEQYDEALLLRKNKSIKKQQLSNLKAHLYKQILSSLRLIDEKNIDIALHEQMDFARILYNKGLYLQSLKVLDKMKDIAVKHNQLTHLQQVLFFEKNIEALFITRSIKDRANQLSAEADTVNNSLVLVSRLSNLSLQLYSWYINNGHCRNKEEEADVKGFFSQQLADLKPADCKGFYEKLYLYQSYCWYAFIRQDFLMYYRYTQKWVNLFEEEPRMLVTETAHYIKGMHNLMGAHFNLTNPFKLRETYECFTRFCATDLVQHNANNRVQCFVYSTISFFNMHFLEGSFTEGLETVPEIEKKISQYEIYLDRHRLLIFDYKIACLYFGSGNYEKAIDYLNKIINWKVDLRTDLQCYSRLLHLIAHYELGNEDILDHLIKSVYRFMAKMKHLSVVEEEIFKFIRRSFAVTVKNIRPELEKLLVKLKKVENNRFETRAFVYLDIISWLESKLEHVPVQEVIRKKFRRKKLQVKNKTNQV